MKKGRGISGVFKHKLKPLPWPLLLVFLFLTAAIAVSGYFYYQKQKKDVFHEQIAQLQAIAELKAANIQHWLGERMGDARLIAENRILTTELLAFLRDRSAGPRRESILGWMESLRNNYHYQNVLLLDGSGEMVLALAGLYPVIGSEGLELMEAVRHRKEAVFSDLHRSEKIPLLHLDVAVPLLAPDTVDGFVFLRIDPADFLYPMIQSWSTPSPSAETLLVRREGNTVLYLNELRHRKNTALNLRFPLTAAGLPAAQAVLGKTGAFSGRDYRGIAVWSVITPVPDSPWFIVAKIDREEIERPIHRSAMAIFLGTLSLILAAALLILFMWQRQNTHLRLRQLEVENQKQALVQHFDYLTRYANDIILLCDEKGNILEVNERAMVAYGFSRKMLLKMNIRDLRIPEERNKLDEQIKTAESPLGMLFETFHQRKDGSVFPVEVSARIIAVNDKKYFQSIVRDISERKRADERLRENETFLNSIIEQSPLAMWISNNQGTLIRINRACCELLQIREDEVIGKYNILQDSIVEAQGLLPLVRKVFENGETVRFEIIYDSTQLQNLELSRKVSLILDTTVFPIKDIHGRVTHAVIQNMNISERKRAEEALRNSENKFSKAFHVSPDVLVISRFADGLIIEVNGSWGRLFGYSREEVIGRNSLEMGLFANPADRQNLAAQLQEQNFVHDFEAEIKCKSGEVRQVTLSVGTIEIDSEPYLLTIIHDITKRKQAESQLNEQIAELQRWHKATLGRETRILDLKREVNELLGQAGQRQRYPSAESQDKKEK